MSLPKFKIRYSLSKSISPENLFNNIYIFSAEFLPVSNVASNIHDARIGDNGAKYIIGSLNGDFSATFVK